jgi:hypothetical protein
VLLKRPSQPAATETGLYPGCQDRGTMKGSPRGFSHDLHIPTSVRKVACSWCPCFVGFAFVHLGNKMRLCLSLVCFLVGNETNCSGYCNFTVAMSLQARKWGNCPWSFSTEAKGICSAALISEGGSFSLF